MDFIACETPTCANGFSFDVGNHTAAAIGFPFYEGVTFFGSGIEPYNQANWRMAIVPAPTTLPLLAIGGAAMAWRKRKSAQALP